MFIGLVSPVSFTVITYTNNQHSFSPASLIVKVSQKMSCLLEMHLSVTLLRAVLHVILMSLQRVWIFKVGFKYLTVLQFCHFVCLIEILWLLISSAMLITDWLTLCADKASTASSRLINKPNSSCLWSWSEFISDSLRLTVLCKVWLFMTELLFVSLWQLMPLAYQPQLSMPSLWGWLMNSSLRPTGLRHSVADWGGSISVVLHRGSSCPLSRAMDDCVMRRSTTSSC